MHNRYWADYYGRESAPDSPSSFALRVLEDLGGADFLIDIGCGNGRDTAAFLDAGLPVLALDQCPQAIAQLEARRRNGRLTTLVADFGDAGTAAQVGAWVDATGEGARGILYARFLLHAVPEELEARFFALSAALAAKRSLTLCLEFRTPQDADRPKATAAHYRRFIDPVCLIAHAARAGFRPTYLTEGLGLATYGVDDAYVARLYLVPNLRAARSGATAA